jgi:glycosyltransferase involved in cell wall biosynthesis
MKALVLSSLTEATGNAVTANRLLCHLEKRFSSVRLVDANASTPGSLRSTVVDGEVDLVVAVHAYRSGRLLLELPRSVHTIIVLGGTDVNEALAPPPLRPGWEDARAVTLAALTRADAVVAFGPPLASRFRGFVCGTPALCAKLVVIGQAAVGGEEGSSDLRAVLGVLPDTPLLLLVAGFRPVKRPLFLLPALAALRADAHPRCSSAALVIVGPPLDADTTLAVAHASGAACLFAVAGLPAPPDSLGQYGGRDGLYCLPPVPHATLLAWTAQADVALNSSDSEGESNALLEAAALGTPRVARWCEGNAALITHGVTGLLFHSAEEAVGSIRSLLVPTAEWGIARLPGRAGREGRMGTSCGAALAAAALAEVAGSHSEEEEARKWAELTADVCGGRRG